MSKMLIRSLKQFICSDLKSPVGPNYKTKSFADAVMQRDHATCHKYKISLMKRHAIGEW